MTTKVFSLRRGRHRRADLPTMLLGLERALQLGEGRIDIETETRAREVLARAGERLRHSAEHTVVALAGATGSGKSSLFNAMVGLDLSPVGVKRPTTDVARACVWGQEGAGSLLEWLGVPLRYQVSRSSVLDTRLDSPDLAGLVLLDLPDHDSWAVAHRLQVDRLVDMVDLIVWVVDPQKYADAALHDDYLRGLAGHEAVCLFVLNQVDRVNPFAASECVNDLIRLLERDGLRRPQVLTTSVRAGTGLGELRQALVQVVGRRRASSDRLVADVEQIANRLTDLVGAAPAVGELPRAARERLVVALGQAAGVPVVTDAVGRAWQDRAARATGWPPTRWVRRLRPDPLRRLRLDRRERTEVRRVGSGRSSLPEPTPVARAQVDSALREVVTVASEGLAPAWRATLRRQATARADDLPDALDRAITGVDLGVERVPLWWRVAGALQWALAVAAAGGAGWLALLAVNGYLRLPDPPTPRVWDIPWPTLLLLGGIGVGLAVAAVGRVLARAGAHRRRRVAGNRLAEAVEGVARRLVLEPVEAELGRHRAARAALGQALEG